MSSQNCSCVATKHRSADAEITYERPLAGCRFLSFIRRAALCLSDGDSKRLPHCRKTGGNLAIPFLFIRVARHLGVRAMGKATARPAVSRRGFLPEARHSVAVPFNGPTLRWDGQPRVTGCLSFASVTWATWAKWTPDERIKMLFFVCKSEAFLLNWAQEKY